MTTSITNINMFRIIWNVVICKYTTFDLFHSFQLKQKLSRDFCMKLIWGRSYTCMSPKSQVNVHQSTNHILYANDEMEPGNFYFRNLCYRAMLAIEG